MARNLTQATILLGLALLLAVGFAGVGVAEQPDAQDTEVNTTEIEQSQHGEYADGSFYAQPHALNSLLERTPAQEDPSKSAVDAADSEVGQEIPDESADSEVSQTDHSQNSEREQLGHDDADNVADGSEEAVGSDSNHDQSDDEVSIEPIREDLELLAASIGASLEETDRRAQVTDGPVGDQLVAPDTIWGHSYDIRITDTPTGGIVHIVMDGAYEGEYTASFSAHATVQETVIDGGNATIAANPDQLYVGEVVPMDDTQPGESDEHERSDERSDRFDDPKDHEYQNVNLDKIREFLENNFDDQDAENIDRDEVRELLEERFEFETGSIDLDELREHLSDEHSREDSDTHQEDRRDELREEYERNNPDVDPDEIEVQIAEEQDTEDRDIDYEDRRDRIEEQRQQERDVDRDDRRNHADDRQERADRAEEADALRERIDQLEEMEDPPIDPAELRERLEKLEE